MLTFWEAFGDSADLGTSGSRDLLSLGCGISRLGSFLDLRLSNLTILLLWCQSLGFKLEDGVEKFLAFASLRLLTGGGRLDRLLGRLLGVGVLCATSGGHLFELFCSGCSVGIDG